MPVNGNPYLPQYPLVGRLKIIYSGISIEIKTLKPSSV